MENHKINYCNFFINEWFARKFVSKHSAFATTNFISQYLTRLFDGIGLFLISNLPSNEYNCISKL